MPIYPSNSTATSAFYTLSLHDALPISRAYPDQIKNNALREALELTVTKEESEHIPDETVLQGYADRKSTRLNSSHVAISYAVFCLKKKKNTDEALALMRL